jgi:hypothetical protein
LGNLRGKELMSNRIQKIRKESEAAALFEIVKTYFFGFCEQSISGKCGHQIYRDRIIVKDTPPTISIALLERR